MTTQTAAAEALAHFTQDTRKDGERFYLLTDDAPEWVRDLVHDAHGDFMPDDFRYAMVRDSLDAIGAGDEDGDELDDPVYTADLLAWVSSNLQRVGYVDDAASEYGHGDGLVSMLTSGYAMEQREVFDSVRESLESHVDEEA